MGVRYASSHMLLPLIVEGDSRNAVQWALNAETLPLKLADYIEGIRDIQFNNDISFSHVLWEAKGNADWLAELEVLRSNFLFYNYDMMMNWFPFLCRALLVLRVSLLLYYLFLIQISSFKKEKKEKKINSKNKNCCFQHWSKCWDLMQIYLSDYDQMNRTLCLKNVVS